MRDLLCSIYVLVIIYCALTIIYELYWDDAPAADLNPGSIQTNRIQDVPVSLDMQYMPSKSWGNHAGRLVRASC